MNLKMFCISLNPKHLKIIKNLNYIPVGLGKASFDSNWLTDEGDKEISYKNPHYGEYTFHYKIWKNDLIKEDDWVGFCQYRKFWASTTINQKELNYNEFNSTILKSIPDKFYEYETILGNEIHINQFRLSKFVKHNFKKMILNPSLFYKKDKRNLKFHFDMMHGDGNLDKAIEMLELDERKDFKEFVNKNTSFNPHNMFICKTKKVLFDYYNSVFPWLERCEKIFGFENLKGYGLQRIYGFLAERYLSYWFKKYTKYTVLPIIFKDISDFNYKDL